MKKLLSSIGLAVLVCVSFSGCRSIRSEKLVEDINNHSNFEIDLLTPVGECDFEGFGMIPGHGVEGYYDKKYGEITENDALNASYVQYDVTSYPDIGFGKKYVTGIYISDPEIHVYGYSVGDNSEDFFDFLEGKGFEEYYNNGRYMMCSKGKVKIRCDVNREKQEINGLYVGMDLTNMLGSMY